MSTQNKKHGFSLPYFIHHDTIGNRIEDTGLVVMSDFLFKNTTLKILNLTRDHKQDTSDFPSQIFTLYIQSTGNMIGIKGTFYLCDALKVNTALTELDLSCLSQKYISHFS